MQPLGHVAHVFRLVLLVAAGMAVFLVWRAWMVPDDFGVYGHYRARALEASAAAPPAHAGEAACAGCHTDAFELKAAGAHAAVTCESCHGAQARHADGSAAAPPALPDAGALCARCHAAAAGRRAPFPQVVVADHAGDASCTLCHQPHTPGLSEEPGS